jgi:hypothetical protein
MLFSIDPMRSLLLSRLSCNTLVRNAGVPNGNMTVLCSLNLAVEAAHQTRKISQSASNESAEDKYTDVSSAKRDTTKSWLVPGILIPLRLELRIRQASGSIASLNSKQESGLALHHVSQ